MCAVFWMLDRCSSMLRFGKAPVFCTEASKSLLLRCKHPVVTAVFCCSGQPNNVAPYRGQFDPQSDGALQGHLSAIPEYLRRFFSDALAVVTPVKYAPLMLVAPCL